MFYLVLGNLENRDIAIVNKVIPIKQRKGAIYRETRVTGRPGNYTQSYSSLCKALADLNLWRFEMGIRIAIGIQSIKMF